MTQRQQGDRIVVVVALEEEGVMIVEVTVAKEVQGAKQKVMVDVVFVIILKSKDINRGTVENFMVVPHNMLMLRLLTGQLSGSPTITIKDSGISDDEYTKILNFRYSTIGIFFYCYSRPDK